MGKKVLYVVYDEGTAIDPRKDYDNIGVLTLSEYGRSRWLGLYNEAGCKYDGDSIEFACCRAPSAFFGSIDALGGLVIPVEYIDYGSNGSRIVLATGRAVYVSPEQYSELAHGWEQHRRDYGGYPYGDDAESILCDVLTRRECDILFSGGYDISKTDGFYVISGREINQWASEHYGASVEGQKAAIEAAESEIATLNLWRNGDVYGGIVVDLETGEQDAVYGFITNDPQTDVVDSGHFEFDEVFGGSRPEVLTYDAFKARSNSDQLAYLRGNRTGNPRAIRRPRR
jgi:hypothetical protein